MLGVERSSRTDFEFDLDSESDFDSGSVMTAGPGSLADHQAET